MKTDWSFRAIPVTLLAIASQQRPHRNNRLKGLLMGALVAVLADAAQAPAGTTSLVTKPNGIACTQPCVHASISAGGRFVVFDSFSANLTPGDTNEESDVFVLDRDLDADGVLDETGAVSIVRASVGAGGQANGSSAAMGLSADGRFVLFTSDASNLVVPDGSGGGGREVFVHDRDADGNGVFDEPGLTATNRVSVASDGTQGNRESLLAAMSPDGRFVAFESEASNLVAGDTNGQMDIFVRDRDADQDGIFDEAGAVLTVRASVAADGSQAVWGAIQPAISGDGRHVVFASFSPNLVPNDTNGVHDIFVHDRDADGDGVFDEPGSIATSRVSIASDGTEGNGNSLEDVTSTDRRPAISTNGRFVAFTSLATNLVPDDTNLARDIFVHDRDADADGVFDTPGSVATLRVSVASGGTQGDGASVEASISPDGRFVVFTSSASTLVAADTNGAEDIFVHDRDVDGDGVFDEPGGAATTRVSVSSDGTQANGHSVDSAVSPTGRFVAFASAANNLAPGDTNGTADVFVHESPPPPPPAAGGKIAFVEQSDIYTMNPDGTDVQRLTFTPGSTEDQPAISPEGTKIAYTSDQGGNGVDVWVMNVDGSSPTRLTTEAATDQNPAWSPDGTKIAFETGRTGLAVTIWVMDADGSNQHLVIDRYPSSNVADPAWSPDGARIAYERLNPNPAIAAASAVDGSGEVTLAAAGGEHGLDPAWSPDGSRLAYRSYDPLAGVGDIWVVDIAGGTETNLTADAADDHSPAFSPDGSQIAYAVLAGQWEIFRMNADGTGKVNVTNDPLGSERNPDWGPAPSAMPALTVGDVSVTEGDSGTTNADFTVRLSAPSDTAISVDYATADGTATASADYTGASGSLTFAPGETVKTIGVSVLGDTDDEPDETFVLDLTNPSGATIADGQGVATIVDDDAPPTLPELSVSDVVVAEGDTGSTPATFAVTLSFAVAQTATVRVQTVGGTAGDCVDYVCFDLVLAFAPGETVKPVTVDVLGDTELEPDETFTVVLSEATNATIADGTGNGTITNDDAAVVSAADLTVVEGNVNSTHLIELTIPQAEVVPVEVGFEALGGSATNGIDYVLASGTATFTPGSTSVYIPLLVVGDLAYEPDETIVIQLTNVLNADVGDGVVVVTITNDDETPDLVVSALSAPATAVPGEIVLVRYWVMNQGTATAGTGTGGCVRHDDVVLTPGSVLSSFPDCWGPLAPGYIQGGAAYVRIPSIGSGFATLTVTTDVGNTISESDESNNTRSARITIVAPDLVVSGVSVPATAAPGELVGIEYTITNEGTASAGTRPGNCQWRDQVEASPGFYGSFTRCVPGQLAPGSSYTQGGTWVRIPSDASGFVTITVMTDVGDSVFESDESNNTRSARITIVAPDLVVSAVSAPETATPGEVVTISFTVKNQGSWPAGDDGGGCQWSDTLRLTPGTWSTSSCGTAPLAPAATYSRTAMVTIPTTAYGMVRLTVTADAGHAVAESNEANNGRVVTIVIETPGDGLR